MNSENMFNCGNFGTEMNRAVEYFPPSYFEYHYPDDLILLDFRDENSVISARTLIQDIDTTRLTVEKHEECVSQ